MCYAASSDSGHFRLIGDIPLIKSLWRVEGHLGIVGGVEIMRQMKHTYMITVLLSNDDLSLHTLLGLTYP
jgi:hypothetical protein